jgi:aspartate-semialdehyde dehydrogenase
MARREYSVAVVGATGAVGQVMRCLASERSAGTTVNFRGESVPVERLTAESFRGVEIALFSAGAARSREFAPAAVGAGAVVVDNSSAFRMDPDVPLVIPEVNGDALIGCRARGIVAVPNCTTIVMVMALKPIHDAARIRRVVASSYQAVSGAGAKALEELRRQTLAWSRGETPVVEAFPHQIAFNLIPHIDVFLEDGYTKEEMKLVHETRKLLGDPTIRVSPTTVRVPVFTAHSVSVNVETERKITAARARELFAAAPGLRVEDEPEKGRYPMPLFVAGTDECVVGRVREDLSSENGLNFWVVGDQLRKGAALNAVQIAEVLIDKHL